MSSRGPSQAVNNFGWLHINDPLSLAEPGSRGPVQVLLDQIANAWAHANQGEALYFCKAAMQCANQTKDVAGTALAQLYLADTYARSGRLAEGADLARSAARRFKLLGDRHNAMVAHILLARLERSLQHLDEARLDYQQALDMCQKLQSEEKGAARRKAALYEQIAVEIQEAVMDIATAIAERFDQMCCLLDSIPILRLSDEPGMVVSKRSDMVSYVSTGEFLIAGRTYYLHPLDEAPGNGPELRADAIHFALPVPEDGWPDPASKKGDYVLVRRETQVTQEGPGVLWTGERWVAGRFERDVATGGIRFVAPQPYIIGREQDYVTPLLERDVATGSIRFVAPQPYIMGEEQGYVIALLKPIA